MSVLENQESIILHWNKEAMELVLAEETSWVFFHFLPNSIGLHSFYWSD